MPGIMIHQDGSTHEWVSGQKWDLIVTMDDAPNVHYSMCFVAEEGTLSSFLGISEVIAAYGLFSSFYSDRGSHYWHTPTAGGRVDKTHPTQFGRALRQLGIEMIAAYSPQARGALRTDVSHPSGTIAKELAAAGITSMAAANHYLASVYRPVFNAEFMQPAKEAGSAFIPWIGNGLETSCASNSSARWAMITVGASTTWSCKYRLTAIAVISSRRRCGSIAIRMVTWPSFMDRANSPLMMH